MNHRKSQFDSVRVGRNICTYLDLNNIPISLPSLSYEVLAMQIRDSISRVRYYEAVSNRSIDIRTTDPNDSLFDPIKAIIYYRNKNYDEACWLAFLLAYTSESYPSKWYFTRKLYAGLDNKLTWNYVNTNRNVIQKIAQSLEQANPKPKFGKHRPYASLKHMQITIGNYIDLVDFHGGHRNLFKNNESHESLEDAFRKLYNILSTGIYGFARLSTFDFISILYKSELADVKADSCYIKGSTGPKRGAKLLFGSNLTTNDLEQHSLELANYLGIGYQEMEDALCNWQKSHGVYNQYRG